MYKALAIILTLWVSIIAPASAQWTEPVRIGAPGGNLYPQILAQGDTLHVVYSNNDEDWKIGYVRSTDRGDTWSNQHVLSDVVNTTLTYFPQIINYNNRLMVLWLCQFNQWPYNYNIGLSISTNQGITWNDPEYVLNQGWAFPFYLAVTCTESIVNIETCGAPDSTMIFHNIRSTNFGQSWSEPTELLTTAQSSIPDAISHGHNVHFTWAGRFNLQSKYETYYMRSTDDGINWTESINISEIDQHHSYWPSISVNNSGELALSWTDFKYSPYIFTGDILLRGSFDSGQYWFAERRATYNHLAKMSDVVIMADTIYISWEDRRSENGRQGIYYMRTTDLGATWGEEYWIDRDSCESRQPAVAALYGNVYVLWSDDRCDPDTDICGGIYFTRLDNQVGIQEDAETILPHELSLDIYPNPFNSKATISLNIFQGGEAKLEIYDTNGRLVKTIFKRGNLEKGTHKFTWDATDAKGKAVSSGLYFAVAGTPQGKISKTLTLIR
jgi:hypothetical protein